MSKELFWLTLTLLMTALFWLPYVLDRIAVRGLMGALANPTNQPIKQSDWAIRAQMAHANGTENLVLFAGLVLAIQLAGLNSETTALASMHYFTARLLHFVVYTAGIPIVRTLAFAVGWGAQMVLALTLLGLI